MIKRIGLFVLALAVGLSAELWVNAIQDPGAELGQGDWETEIWEHPSAPGSGDSAEVNAHDTSRAYEGEYSFLTDTKKNPRIGPAKCYVYCLQELAVPKAVSDLDSCYWVVYLNDRNDQWLNDFSIMFRSKEGKTLRWASGGPYPLFNDTIHTYEFTTPDSGEWRQYGDDFYDKWGGYEGWSMNDTIVKVELHSWCVAGDGQYYGQEVSWDNIELRSIAYYDYAAESIDSDDFAEYHYTPIATFSNQGKKEDEAGMVYAEVLEGETRVYIDSQEVSIPSEGTEQVTFKEWTVLRDGSYTLQVYPLWDLDEYAPDDTLQKELIGVSIKEAPLNQTPLLEVTYSTIRYTLPTAEPGILSIYDATGRRIERMQVTGSGSLEFSSDLSSGVYLVQLKTAHNTVIRKALILR